MEQRQLRDAFGVFATGVTVVTCTSDDGRPHGATVTAFTPISLDPPLVQISLTREARACAYLADRSFAVNVLAEHQLDVAWHFAGRPSTTAPVLNDGPTAPVLADAVATISCTSWTSYDGGDHLLFLGAVTEVSLSDRDPLLFHRSSFKCVGPRLDASAWLGCSDDPSTGWFNAATSFQPTHLATPASA